MKETELEQSAALQQTRAPRGCGMASTRRGDAARPRVASERSRASSSAVPATTSGAGRRAVVVGGGPCGALTALYLARDGWKVRENWRDPRSVRAVACIHGRTTLRNTSTRPSQTSQVTVSEAREASAATTATVGADYNVVLTDRAFAALSGAGLDVRTLPEATVVEGTISHGINGKPPSQRKPFSPGMVSVGRAEIARCAHPAQRRVPAQPPLPHRGKSSVRPPPQITLFSCTAFSVYCALPSYSRSIQKVTVERFPASVDWRWSCAATGLDPTGNKARRSPSGCSASPPRHAQKRTRAQPQNAAPWVPPQVTLASGESLPFDLLVIADGVHSPMRRILASQARVSTCAEDKQ